MLILQIVLSVLHEFNEILIVLKVKPLDSTLDIIFSYPLINKNTIPNLRHFNLYS